MNFIVGPLPSTTTAVPTEPMASVSGSVPVLPKVCYAEESNEGDNGIIVWPETEPGVNVKVECPYQKSIGDTTYATRSW